YDYAVRAETQAARLLNLSARKGKNWKVAKVYQISVLDFHFDKDDKSALEWYTMRKASGGKLGERLNVIFFDLLKIKKLLGTPPEKLTKLEKWGLFLSYAEDETKKDYLESLINSEEGIMNAKTALSKVSQDDINWAIENSIFKARMDYNTGLYNAEQRGLRQGLEQGEHKAQIETAKRMLEAKICSLEQVAAMTNLSIEEVKGLQKQG
ncbi:MAG: PD-(D/E)XK nuclease family transposase, partial [Treponema sp.]|nr:PD-(D/E)XK nuclease family transposase [Treponema sp.]